MIYPSNWEIQGSGEASPETKGATKAEILRNHMRSQYLKPNAWPTEQKEEYMTGTKGRCQGQSIEPEFWNQADN